MVNVMWQMGWNVGRARVRKCVVNIASGTGPKGAPLTERDHVDKESSRRRGLAHPPHSGVYDFHIRVIVLFDRIPIGYRQDDSTRGPKHSRESDVLGPRVGEIKVRESV